MGASLAEADPTPGRRWNPWETTAIQEVDTAQIGFSVYGMETSLTRDSRGLRPFGVVAGGLSGTLKVRKAHAVLNTAAWQGGTLRPPLEPPASRAAGRAADWRGTPLPEPRRRCAPT